MQEDVTPKPDEAAKAITALCPQHGSRFVYLNREGQLYYCPVADHFWKVSKGNRGMYSPLAFPRGL